MVDLLKVGRVARGMGWATIDLALVIVSSVVIWATIVAFQSGADEAITTYRDRFEDRDTTGGSTDDYMVFYVAGDLVRRGHGEDLYDLQRFPAAELEVIGRPVGRTGSYLFFNPPFVALMWSPLALLSLDAALAWWAGLIALAALVIAVSGPMFLGIRGWRAVAASLAMVAATGTVFMVLQAQFTVFVMAGWVGMLAFVRRGRPDLGGAMLSLCLVKPQFVVLPLIWLLYRYGWRAGVPFAGITGALVLVSIVVAGPGSLIEYPSLLIESSSWERQYGVTADRMHSWTGLFPEDRLLATALGALGIGLAIWRTLVEPSEIALGALMLAAMLATPHLYGQDTALLLVVLFVALAQRPSVRVSIAVILAVLITQLLTRSFLNGGESTNWGVVGTAALLAAFVVATFRRTEAASESPATDSVVEARPISSQSVPVHRGSGVESPP
jgi:hypothetical protein